jgi:hypothetical protein
MPCATAVAAALRLEQSSIERLAAQPALCGPPEAPPLHADIRQYSHTLTLLKWEARELRGSHRTARAATARVQPAGSCHTHRLAAIALPGIRVLAFNHDTAGVGGCLEPEALSQRALECGRPWRTAVGITTRVNLQQHRNVAAACQQNYRPICPIKCSADVAAAYTAISKQCRQHRLGGLHVLANT